MSLTHLTVHMSYIEWKRRRGNKDMGSSGFRLQKERNPRLQQDWIWLSLITISFLLLLLENCCCNTKFRVSHLKKKAILSSHASLVSMLHSEVPSFSYSYSVKDQWPRLYETAIPGPHLVRKRNEVERSVSNILKLWPQRGDLTYFIFYWPDLGHMTKSKECWQIGQSYLSSNRTFSSEVLCTLKGVIWWGIWEL